MRTVRVTHPTKKVAATIQLPSSKSISNRVLILQAISGNNIALENISTADDTLIMQSALFQKTGIIDVKNAGTCMRFLTAYFASINCEVEMQCDERMKLRPIKILVDALRDLGADISYLQEEGFPPLKIKGKQLDGGNIKMNASVSSQFISALMLVAPIFKNGLEIELTEEISSKSYIEMTANLMTSLGFDCTFINNKITINNQAYKQSNNQNLTYQIEQDWSSAAFWYEIVALSEDAEILLKDLSLKSLQGDCIISEYMKVFGVETIETDEGVLLRKIKSSNHQIIKSFNLLNTLDLAPTIAVTAAAKNIETELSGLKNLKIKESDRLKSLETELKKCNFNIVAKDDSLYIKQNAINYQPSTISLFQTYNDHRLAMSLAPLALLFDDVMIENPDVVEKSYPHFWEDLKLAGFELEFNI
jgi:3-phosphoshikimate 1-carboxyvinyltransferase